MVRPAWILLLMFFLVLELLCSCSHEPSTRMKSIADEKEEVLTSELFDLSSRAQQNINPNTTMPVMPHTVKEMECAAGMKQ